MDAFVSPASGRLRSYAPWGAAALLAAGIILSAQVSYLLYHILVELFAIIIGLLMGVVAWFTYGFSRNHFLTFLGLAYPWVAGIDLIHALAYEGMALLPMEGANQATQLWVAARLLEASALLVSPTFLRRPLPSAGMLTAVFGVAALLLVGSVFAGLFPTAYVEGRGLTPFKVDMEYLVVLLLAVAGVRIWRRRDELDREVLLLVAGAWALTIAGELAFTFYVGVYDLSNFIGHLCKLGSFWLVYLGVVRTSLAEPFRILSRDATTYDAIPEEILVVDRDGRVRRINGVLAQRLGPRAANAIGADCHDLVHPRALSRDGCPVCNAIAAGRPLAGEELEVDGRWMLISLAPIGGDRVRGMVHVARDISARKRAQQALERSNRALRAIGASNHALVRTVDEAQLLTEVCRIVVEKGGYRMAWVGLADDDAQKRIRPVSHAGFEEGYLSEQTFSWAEDSDWGAGPAGTALRTGRLSVSNSIATDPGFGPWREAALRHGYAAVMAFPLLAEGEAPFGVLVIYSERKNVFVPEEVRILGELASDLGFGIHSLRTRQARQVAERGLVVRTAALDTARNGVLILKANEGGQPPIYANAALEAITGWAREAFLGPEPEAGVVRELLDAVRRGEHESTGHHAVRPDGSEVWYEIKVSAVKGEEGTPSHWVGIVNDITDRVHYEQQLEYQAHHDDLTGLPNRTLMKDRLQQSMSLSQRNRRGLAVLFLDLDRFKLVNDSLGHGMGDQVLKVASERLQSCMRAIDSVTRYGGDEFVILLPDIGTPEGVGDMVRRMADTLAQPLQLGDHELRLTASIGTAFYPGDGDSVETLLSNADAAMYRAKDAGRNNVQFFTRELNARALERLTLEGELYQALERDELVLYYQPQADLENMRVIGVEALVRWNHPRRGVVSPGQFIPVAEESGLIIPLGDWVLRAACRQAADWERLGLPLRMAVNVSTRQLADDAFVERVHQVLDETGLDPALLELEVTETLVMSDPENMVGRLRRIRDLGVAISMDDFGTGYSGLGYLKRLPVGKLKIDQSFVRDLVYDPEDAAIARTVIDIARNLRMGVLAEGVETEAQLRYLERSGCLVIQGYYFSYPRPAEELQRLLSRTDGIRFPDRWQAGRGPVVLMVGDSVDRLPGLPARLNAEGGGPLLVARSAEEGFDRLAVYEVAVVLVDRKLGQMGGGEFLRRVRELHPDTVRLLMDDRGESSAVSVGEGPYDGVIAAPWQDDLVSERVRTALHRYRARRDAA